MYSYRHPEEVETILKELMGQTCTSRFLGIIKSHHEDTYEHSIRVAGLSIDLAIENGLSAKTVRLIGQAAILHDYGKSKINVKILSKCSTLTPLETLIVTKHSKIGAQELKKFLPKRARIIIDRHHSPVNLMSEIVSAADMYDALIFPRAYKDGYELDKVSSIMLEQFAGKRALIHQLTKRPRRI